ncbi:AlpA family phage regulatory protein [Thiobacillus denitrificans]|uniref:helix-turn-helix transcriptional regulator n=1 Tax=Thiobacillus denitrificans TaxID=36861 RepID=UPI0009E7B51F
MKLLSYSDLVYRLRLSRSTLERMVVRAEIPPPVQVSSGAVRFVEDEIEAWLTTCPRTKTTPAS